MYFLSYVISFLSFIVSFLFYIGIECLRNVLENGKKPQFVNHHFLIQYFCF